MGKRGNNEGTLYHRKDGKWEAKVSIGYDDEGNLKRLTKYFKTRQEGAAWLAEVQTQQNTGQFIQPNKITVGEWMERWLNMYCKLPLIKNTTFENYETVIRVHILPSDLGNISLQTVTTADVQKFLVAKLTGGRADGKEGGLSPRMVQYLRFLIKTALKQARREGLISRNVAEDVVLPKMTSKKKKPAFLTAEQVDRFLDAAEGDRLFPALQMELGTGLRRGELLALKWTDLDLEGGTVTVRRQLVILRGKAVFHDHAKTEAGERVVTLPQDVIESLRFHKRRQDNEKKLCGETYEDHGLVFCQENGKPMRS